MFSCSVWCSFIRRYFVLSIFFFFKQKTAYEMRISDWSSDVCSSDLGVWGMAHTSSAVGLYLFGGVVTGLGVAFTAFSLAMAAMAKVVGPERRSLALGLGTASGSFGQVVFSPLGQAFIPKPGWTTALHILALSALLVIPLAFVLPPTQPGSAPGRE